MLSPKSDAFQQVCWKLLSQLGAGDLPLDDVVKHICLEKQSSSEPLYLK